MELTIVEHPNEILTSHNIDAQIEDISYDLIESMYKLMVDKNGVGLAAPQIGINKKFFIYSIDKSIKNLKIVLNPKIIRHGKDVEYITEGCLSVPGQHKQLKRWRVIDVEYTELKEGKILLTKVTLKGWEAKVFQHEFDHLQGILCMFKEDNVITLDKTA